MMDDPDALPDFPERLLDQVLADPQAMEALGDYARRRGITTPLAAMPREELRRIAGALMAEARAARTAAVPADEGLADRTFGVPDGLTEAVFADEQARAVLADLAAAHGWSEAPAALPEHIKRMLVRMLIDEGVIEVGDASPD